MQSRMEEMQERALITPREQDGKGTRMDTAKKFVINKLNEYEKQKLLRKRRMSAAHQGGHYNGLPGRHYDDL